MFARLTYLHYFIINFRYNYKFIVSGQWRHSTSSPTERDEHGNLNNIIVVGDIANVRPSIQPRKKVLVFPTAHFCSGNMIGHPLNQS